MGHKLGNPDAEKKKVLNLISDFDIKIAPLNDDIVDYMRT